ncbi:MAG TPA: oxalate/formate MFS antiporter, partial [Gemmatimonadaceae bacterium]|nr:oxalate/formate MFS antiporter [Gemmatimonadaceae bacterium]
ANTIAPAQSSTLTPDLSGPASLPDDTPRGFARWWQLILGVICMSMIANLQYGWTLFVNPIQDRHHWGLPAIQVAFSIFVLVETWLVPFEGYLVDRFGPQMVGVTSGILVAAAWTIDAYANTIPALYVGAIVGGIGAGGVYGACVGNALKWFPDRRGLAAGVTAMGFGAGSALTVYPIANMIQARGYEAAFLKFGIAQGAVVFIVGWFLRGPQVSGAARDPGRTSGSTANVRDKREYTPLEMLRSPAFWVMYVMFMLTASGGLIMTAQIKPIAKTYGIGDAQAVLLGLTVATVPFTLSMSRILNGVSRPFFGWLSDRFGRERTMSAAFMLEAIGFYLISRLAAHPAAFVVLTGILFFAYGEIYSLFPAACADSYGRRYVSANAGLLYTAKGAAALLVPLSGIIAVSAAGWNQLFVILAFMNVAAAALAVVAMKPLRERLRGGHEQPMMTP